MSAEDASRTGSADVDATLVAALGFEPTMQRDDGSGDLLVDESGGQIDWSADSAAGVQGAPLDADGVVAATAPATRSARATGSTMTPPKGKGKGPRTFAGDRSNGTSTSDRDDSSSADEVTIDDHDPAVTAEVPTGSSADRNDAPVPDADRDDQVDGDPDVTQPISTADIASAEAAGAEAPVADPDAGSEDPGRAAPSSPDVALDDTGPQPVGGLFDDPEVAVADSLSIVDPAEAAAAANATEMTTPVVDPGEPTMAVATPVVDPPPPAVGDAITVNGAGAAVTAAPTVARAPVGRTTGTPSTPGELVTRLPELLDSGLLKRNRRVRARKVRRVIRHIDPWSVLTFSVLFFLCLFDALLLASVLVWNAAVAAGTIENIESFIREIGDYQTYKIQGDVVFQAAMIIAGILTLAASVTVVLLVVVFNLISDLVGGIRLTVVEEETVRVRRRPKTSSATNGQGAATAQSAPNGEVQTSGPRSLAS